jgi:hypothetical protein
MIDAEVEYGPTPEITADMIREQLDLLVHDEVFRSSKRSVAFLKFVVEQTLNGAADQLKERTIGVEVFGRDPSYDTNLDHIVRTAATELRKKLATYYVAEKHRNELRMGLVPGSYIPRFTIPDHSRHPALDPAVEADVAEPSFDASTTHFLDVPLTPAANKTPEREMAQRKRWVLPLSIASIAAIAVLGLVGWLRHAGPADLFWRPVLDTPGSVLLVVGDHPNGPPTLPISSGNNGMATPVPSSDSSQTVPFADTVTIARVVGALEARGKNVDIRSDNTSSFSDLRKGAVVLIGAFNNEWSLRLTRPLRYSLTMDPGRHLVYIQDSKNPGSRDWSWATNQPAQPVTGVNSPKIHDFALISRIRDSETGHAVVVIGGLYTYGTEAAGEFLTNPDIMQSVASQVRSTGSQNLQIVLGTTVTDGIPGPPRVLAVSAE